MKTDLIIIGAGPVGLYAAFYAGMRGMSVRVIESLYHVGGQLKAVYPEKFIYDVPGFRKITAGQYIENLKDQAEQFKDKIEFSLGEGVESLSKRGERDFLITTTSNTYEAKSILIAAGNGAFEPRKLEVNNEKIFHNIHYFVLNMERYANKDVLVLGGGDSAVDWANMLTGVAKSVTLAHRRNEFRAHEHSVETLRESSATILTPYKVNKLSGRSGLVKQVELVNNETDETKILDVDYLIVNFGFKSSIGPIKEWGLDIHKNSIIVDRKLSTNVDGIYAVGNIAHYEGKLKLIVCGLGETPIAINEIKQYIDPNAKQGPIHSSSLMDKK